MNSLAHFLAIVGARPFSRRKVRAVRAHWDRTSSRIFGVTVGTRNDNGGDFGPAPHVFVWLNQSKLGEAALLNQAIVPADFWICNIEYALFPFRGWSSVFLGHPVIVRQWKRQAKRAIERAADRVRRGESCAISIEGARSHDGHLLPYKKGPVVLALQAQATIVPFVTRGIRERLPPGEWRVRPGSAEVHFLEAIPTKGLTYDDRDALVARLRDIAVRELGRAVA